MWLYWLLWEAFGDYFPPQWVDGREFLIGFSNVKKALRWSECKGCLSVCCRGSLTYCKVIHSSYVHWGQPYLTAAITTTPPPVQRCQPLALVFSFILVRKQLSFCIIALCRMQKMTFSLHTCSGLFFNCWRLHNILIRNQACRSNMVFLSSHWRTRGLGIPWLWMSSKEKWWQISLFSGQIGVTGSHALKQSETEKVKMYPKSP